MMKYILIAALLLSVTPARADPFWGGFAGGALGGVAGSVIGGWLNRPQRPPPPAYGGGGYDSDAAIRYCMSRFRSYNPETGIYWGYDRQPHRCP
jgi:hypothetical protein